MQYSLHPEASYLRVQMSGMPSKDEVRDMFVAMAREAASGPRALIVLRVDDCLNFLDTMQVMAELAVMGVPPGYRLALLITDEKMRASAQFAETAGVNR